jgi:hypothetical protein
MASWDAIDTRAMPSHRVSATELLLQELLDAQADTVQILLARSGLAVDDADVHVRCHIDYLQALQRYGKALLAESR